jgi:hypothetical protein
MKYQHKKNMLSLCSKNRMLSHGIGLNCILIFATHPCRRVLCVSFHWSHVGCSLNGTVCECHTAWRESGVITLWMTSNYSKCIMHLYTTIFLLIICKTVRLAKHMLGKKCVAVIFSSASFLRNDHRYYVQHSGSTCCELLNVANFRVWPELECIKFHFRSPTQNVITVW